MEGRTTKDGEGTGRVLLKAHATEKLRSWSGTAWSSFIERSTWMIPGQTVNF